MENNKHTWEQYRLLVMESLERIQSEVVTNRLAIIDIKLELALRRGKDIVVISIVGFIVTIATFVLGWVIKGAMGI